MRAVMDADGTSVTRIHAEAMAREECKVLNCSCQKAAANPPRSNLECCCLICLIHFDRHILLAISAPWCRFLEIQSVLKTPHSDGCDGLLRICWQCLLAISTFKLDDWNQIYNGHTFCWLSRRHHVGSWKLKVFWKHRTQADATAASEFAGDVS